MTKDGLKILDSDMHVFEPYDLYLNYMDKNGGTGSHAENHEKREKEKA